MGPEAIALSCVLLLSLGWSLRGESGSPAARYLRTLIPNWRFFQSIDVVPQLFYRVRNAEGDYGAWQEALPPLPRGAGALLIGGASNLRLAEHGVVEALAQQMDGLTVEAAQGLVVYRMVQSMVEARIRERSWSSARYQFRLMAGDGLTADEEIYCSEEHILS